MITALQKPAPEDPPKRITVDINKIHEMHLHDFVTVNSKQFFHLLSIPDAFVQTDPETWQTNSDYLKAEETVQAPRVTNDTAERGIALIQEYGGLLSKDEDQTQFTLQVVAEHRKLFPDCNKTTVLHGLSTATL
jgi:hypothetical protein